MSMIDIHIAVAQFVQYSGYIVNQPHITVHDLNVDFLAPKFGIQMPGIQTLPFTQKYNLRFVLKKVTRC